MSAYPETKIRAAGVILRCVRVGKNSVKVVIRPENGRDIIAIGKAPKGKGQRPFWKGRLLTIEGTIKGEDGESTISDSVFANYGFNEDDYS